MTKLTGIFWPAPNSIRLVSLEAEIRTQRDNGACTEGRHVKGEQEGGRLGTGERGLEETDPASALVLDFQPPEM